MSKIKLLCCLSLCLLCKVGCAQEERLQIHGFVAQGLIQAKDSNFVNDDGDVSAKLTEVGLNGSYQINSSLRIAAQGVYLNGGNRYPEGFRLDYLFLDWQWVNSLDWQVDLHLGRNKNYHWLYSATRDIPHTRPTIVLPQSIYIDVTRDVSIGTDGIAARALRNNHLGEWEFNWSLGQVPNNTQQTQLFIGSQAKGKLILAKEHMMSLYWRPRSSNSQLGVVRLDADYEYRQGVNDSLLDGSGKIRSIYINYRYNSEYWSFASEYNRMKTDIQGVVSADFGSNETSEGIYFQGQYFISPTLTATVQLDILDNNRADRDGSLLESETGVPAFFGFMDQAVLGLSWNFANNWQVQAEFHRVKGVGNLGPLLLPDVTINNSKYWNLWAAQLVYWF
jgi:hypothetical protein